MIYGIRPAGSRQLRWVESDEAFTAGDCVVAGNDMAAVVVVAQQFRESSSNVVPERLDLRLPDDSFSMERHGSEIELDRMLTHIPAVGSHWTADGVRGIVELIDLKRGTFAVRDPDGTGTTVLTFDSLIETGED